LIFRETCSDFRTDADLSTAFDLVTTACAAVLGQAHYGLTAGAIADFVVVAADSIPAAVTAHPQRKWGIKQGHIVAQNGHVLGQGISHTAKVKG
jgi:cytosine/creatinine deaminase